MRSAAGLFDVSHMCSLRWRGKDAIKFVESVTVADVHGLAMHSGTLSVIPLENGGILDDTMITKTSDAQVSLSLPLSTRVTGGYVCLCSLYRLRLVPTPSFMSI